MKLVSKTFMTVKPKLIPRNSKLVCTNCSTFMTVKPKLIPRNSKLVCKNCNLFIVQCL